jgi:CubicO group peptidase (beta-lactamase class C family)
MTTATARQETTRAEITQEDESTKAIRALVEAGALAGATTLAWQNGKVVHAAAIGWRDVEAQAPMERDSLFRIASMSKPITSTAALMLMEEGRFALDDPISRWAPEFTQMRVLRAANGPLDQTVAARRPITFGDLLTHRSGLTYAEVFSGPIAQAYKAALGGDIDNELGPDEWIARLATLPLIDQPGATLHYGHSTDLLGFLIARMEDAPLGDVLKRRILDPLGMQDTGFTVPREKAARRAGMYGFNETGRLTKRLTAPGGSTVAERPAEMTFVSGGQGLWSTVDDYLAFARIFVGGGAVEGVRILRPETLRLMVTNQLNANQRASAEVVGMPVFVSGHGFGLGVAVVMEPEKAEAIICGGRAGAVGWPGAFGGWWQADPNDNSVRVFLAHNMLEAEQMAQGIGLGVYGAIARFQALELAG